MAPSYTPRTGARCSCKRGVMRDNCPTCEGTGMVIDFRAIHAARALSHAPLAPSASPETQSVAPALASCQAAWDRSGCREAVCYCHDEASTPRFCGHCGCRPEQAQVSP